MRCYARERLFRFDLCLKGVSRHLHTCVLVCGPLHIRRSPLEFLCNADEKRIVSDITNNHCVDVKKTQWYHRLLKYLQYFSGTSTGKMVCLSMLLSRRTGWEKKNHLNPPASIQKTENTDCKTSTITQWIESTRDRSFRCARTRRFGDTGSLTIP